MDLALIIAERIERVERRAKPISASPGFQPGVRRCLMTRNRFNGFAKLEWCTTKRGIANQSTQKPFSKCKRFGVYGVPYPRPVLTASD